MNNFNNYLQATIDKIKYNLNKFSYLKNKFTQEELDNAIIEKLYFSCNKIFKISITKNNVKFNYVIKSTLYIWGETNNEYEILENVQDSHRITKIYDYIFLNTSLYYLMEYVNTNNSNKEIKYNL